jgi:D-3-phosphoglycerate dehydrogenase
MDILKLNSISKQADAVLDGYNLVTESDNPAGILVRSFNMAEYRVPSSLLAVARAGAGVNNIPHADYAKKGICVFNTPGANANAVKELVIASLLICARNINESIAWATTLSGDDVAKQVEKGKAAFAGTEIAGKTLCVLGLGAIGRKVASAAHALDMQVVGYDPYISQKAREEIPFATVCDTLEAAYANADYITLHMPLTSETKAMINAESISKMKNGVIILNAARGELADIDDVKAAIADKKIRKYMTDFPNGDCVGCSCIVATPHIGASTEEAEDNCAYMAAVQLKDYIENGNIVNSVNLPALKLEKGAAHRVSVISYDTAALPIAGVSANRGGYAYTLIDTDKNIDLNALASVEGVIKVRRVY